MLKDKPLNRNSIRSIKLLTESMMELLNKYKFKDISVSQITQLAGLARNTFYAHFETKENLVSQYIFNLFSSKVENIINDVRTNKNFDLLYFEMWSENKDLLKLLYRNNLLYLLNDFDYYINELSLEYKLYDNCNFSPLSSQYVNSIYANALGSIVIQWLKLDFVQTPTELSNIFKEVIR